MQLQLGYDLPTALLVPGKTQNVADPQVASIRVVSAYLLELFHLSQMSQLDLNFFFPLGDIFRRTQYLAHWVTRI